MAKYSMLKAGDRFRLNGFTYTKGVKGFAFRDGVAHCESRRIHPDAKVLKI